MQTIYHSESSGHGPRFLLFPVLFPRLFSEGSASAARGPAARTWIRFSGHLALYTDPEPASVTPVLSVVCV